MKLYEISAQYRDIQALAEDPDIPVEAIEYALVEVHHELQVKATNIVAVILGMEAEAGAIKDAETRMTARRKALESRAKWLREYVMTHMDRAGISEIKSPEILLRVRASQPAVVIDDERALPGWAVDTEIIAKIRRADIRKRIEAGETVPGAHLQHGQWLEVR